MGKKFPCLLVFMEAKGEDAEFRLLIIGSEQPYWCPVRCSGLGVLTSAPSRGLPACMPQKVLSSHEAQGQVQVTSKTQRGSGSQFTAWLETQSLKAECRVGKERKYR